MKLDGKVVLWIESALMSPEATETCYRDMADIACFAQHWAAPCMAPFKAPTHCQALPYVTCRMYGSWTQLGSRELIKLYIGYKQVTAAIMSGAGLHASGVRHTAASAAPFTEHHYERCGHVDIAISLRALPLVTTCLHTAGMHCIRAPGASPATDRPQLTQAANHLQHSPGRCKRAVQASLLCTSSRH
jgi:hypothetical protein